jgi:hypothetical protein
MMNRYFSCCVVALIVAAFTGCAPTPKSVTMAELQGSLNKMITMKGSRDVATSDISSKISLDDLSLVSEVCKADYLSNTHYEFDGSMMRFKLEHYAYLFPVDQQPDSRLYVHNYAVCSSFYPSKNESDIQEVVAVRYIAIQKSNYGAVISKVSSFEGGYQGLLQDAGFNTGLSINPNGWSNVTRKTFDPENQLFLKMEVLNMDIINKYDGEKFDDLLAVEYVYANVSNVNGTLTIQGTPVAIIQEVFSNATEASS